MAKALFRTAGQTGVSAGDPPIRPDVQTSESPDVEDAERTDVEAPERTDVEDATRLAVEAARRIDRQEARRMDAQALGRGDVGAPRRREVQEALRLALQASRRPGGEDDTTAYSWKMTGGEALDLDVLTLTLRGQLGRLKLDKKDVLRHLVAAALDNDFIQAQLVAAMRAEAA